MSCIIYGGLFDPPHLGHFEIASCAFRTVKPEIFYWVPSRTPPHRNVEGESAEKRFEMLKWYYRGNEKFRVSAVELNPEHSGYTLETVIFFKNKFPGKKCYLLIGSDEAESFTMWKGWQDILNMAVLIIGRRKEKISLDSRVRDNSVVLNNKIYEISSTDVRQRLYENRPVEGLIDGRILEYIKKHGLYRKK